MTLQPEHRGPVPSEGVVLSVVPSCEPSPSPTQLGLCRRLRAALYDLGLLATTGWDWAAPAGEGIGFADLPVRAADRLVRELEDLGTGGDPPWHPAAAADEVTDYEQLTPF